jgi:hypothetical protein
MRLVHSPMKTDEVRERALRTLTPHLSPFGLTDIEVREERDFDGTDVYRVVAKVTQPVPPRVLIDGSDELQQLLRSEGEEQWLYLSTRREGRSSSNENKDVD